MKDREILHSSVVTYVVQGFMALPAGLLAGWLWGAGWALAAYGLSYVFSQNGGDYRMLFAIGTAAMVLALAIDLVAGIQARKA